MRDLSPGFPSLPLESNDQDRAVELLLKEPATHAVPLSDDQSFTIAFHFRKNTHVYLACVLTSFKAALSVSLIIEHEGDQEMITLGGMEIPDGLLNSEDLPDDPTLIRLHYGRRAASIFLPRTYSTIIRIGDKCDFNMVIEPVWHKRAVIELRRIQRFMLL